MEAIGQVSQCCDGGDGGDGAFVLDNGFTCCRNCGGVRKRELDVNHMSFNQQVSRLAPTQYTRTARFSQKVVGALLQTTNYKPTNSMILYLNSCRRRNLINTPEELLTAVANYKTDTRRPYMHATTLWTNMIHTTAIPVLQDVDKRFICLMFEEIFYVWTRLDFPTPRLPMAQAIFLIVEQFDMGATAKYLTRFLRKLKCIKRRTRYVRLFTNCLSHIKNERHRSQRFENFRHWRKWVEADNNKELLRSA
jgi:hypothetical protein